MTDINDLSIFGDYSNLENRVTVALLHIFNAGKEELIRFIANKIKITLPSSEIDIISQEKQQESIPDGTLKCGFMFNLFIESKIKQNSINTTQLMNHKKAVEKVTLTNPNSFLLYLTPDTNKPTELDEEVYWTNWDSIISWLKEYIESHEEEELKSNSLLIYLVEQLEVLLINKSIISGEWNFSQNDKVLIVGGKDFGEKTAIECGKYFSQGNRTFRPSGYIAFYYNHRIEYCFEIIEPPKENQKLMDYQDLFNIIKEKGAENADWVKEPKRIFILGKRVPIQIIHNDKKNRHGDPTAFTYNQTYTTIDKLKKAKLTSEL